MKCNRCHAPTSTLHYGLCVPCIGNLNQQVGPRRSEETPAPLCNCRLGACREGRHGDCSCHRPEAKPAIPEVEMWLMQLDGVTPSGVLDLADPQDRERLRAAFRAARGSAAATPVDYDSSFDRLGDIIDEQFGLQPVMTQAEKLSFLWRRLTDDRREFVALRSVAETLEESLSIETPRSVLRALREWRKLTDDRGRAAAKNDGR